MLAGLTSLSLILPQVEGQATNPDWEEGHRERPKESDHIIERQDRKGGGQGKAYTAFLSLGGGERLWKEKNTK